MSQPVPGRPGVFFDTTTGLTFYYDQQSDQLVYSNGQRFQRPQHVPRSAYLPQALQQQYQYRPLSSSDGYVTSPSNYPSSSGGDTPRPRERHQSQPSVNALTTSMQNVSLNSAAAQPRVYEHDGIRMVATQNPRNQIRTIIGTGPPDKITDPLLFRGGVRAVRRLYGSEGNTEALYPTFRLKSHDFFSVGRVFMVLWAEPAGESKTAITSNELSDGTLPGAYKNERVYSKVRRFVIVREGQDYCSALPIMTYSKQGVAKSGVVKSEHAIIHTGTQPPTPDLGELPQHAGESPMRQHAVRVVADDRENKLDPMSRVDFGKVHTIQHNIKVKPFGNVHKDSMHALVTQFNNVWLGTSGASASNTTSTARSASGSGGASSSRRKSTDSARRPTGLAVPRRGNDLGNIESEGESDDGSDEDNDESEDDTPSAADVLRNQTRQHYSGLRAQGYPPEQVINSLAARERQLDSTLSQEAAVARIRSRLSNS